MKAVKYTDADMRRAAQFASGMAENGVFMMSDLHRLAQQLADEREFAAQQCDEVAKSASRTPGEKALARQLAKRIREGRP